MMDLLLTRKEYEPYGIFSEITIKDTGKFFSVGLEHSYLVGGAYVPKLAPGTYACIRGIHQLANMDHPFETFEITNVPDFNGLPVTHILLHVGNYNQDSEGCVLLGEHIGGCLNGSKMITNSKVTFDKFMTLQKCVDSFNLTVE